MDRETDLGQRVAVLETEWQRTKDDLKEIKEKLDELLQLKSRGIGAIQLVSLIIGSGVIGIIVTVMNLFSGKPHL